MICDGAGCDGWIPFCFSCACAPLNADASFDCDVCKPLI